ncbi:Site-specific recombinase, phage integrase family [Moritella viscosa]|uniref:site-specific integrase n=1 Tax=Moritella viscosa TaxID=80854 RepID=UPI000911733B|nr:site-specific integrase [Moritella viscosa]SHO21425.1 Site-specific recombinase, phage integrase family [Moritella viscosa]
MLDKNQRVELIPVVEHCNSTFQTFQDDKNAIQLKPKLFQLYEFQSDFYEQYNVVYQLPYIFEVDGSPWVEANLYLYSLAKKKFLEDKRSTALRLVASNILEYKIFCENHKLDAFDFSSLRPVGRPSYRFFKHLIEEGGVSPRVLNGKTLDVYSFYKYVHENNLRKFDMKRVDVTKQVDLLIKTRDGFISKKDVTKRSQTVDVPRSPATKIGFVNDEGEDLQPLMDDAYGALLSAISDGGLTHEQRLITCLALLTGERKQTILTIRHKHLDQFNESNLSDKGVYKLKLSPFNGADTKFDKPHVLDVPVRLADMLKQYSKCEEHEHRVAKFQLKNGDVLSKKDMYLFISREGNCHYMAKNDPRYLKVKTIPTGWNTKTICDKIIKNANSLIPADFTFHWLRATFAYQYYLSLQPMIKSGELSYGDDIDIIRKKLHHAHRETTEGYLKLFTSVDSRINIQRLYENKLFGESMEGILNE